MANLPESAKWEAGIFQLEPTTPALGGVDGPMNTAPKQLANRTQYLKVQADALNSEISAARSGSPTLKARIDSLASTHQHGIFRFASTEGARVVHNVGSLNYSVNVVPEDDTNGEVGDVAIKYGTNFFIVYNTGEFTGQGRYSIVG